MSRTRRANFMLDGHGFMATRVFARPGDTLDELNAARESVMRGHGLTEFAHTNGRYTARLGRGGKGKYHFHCSRKRKMRAQVRRLRNKQERRAVTCHGLLREYDEECFERYLDRIEDDLEMQDYMEWVSESGWPDIGPIKALDEMDRLYDEWMHGNFESEG